MLWVLLMRTAHEPLSVESRAVHALISIAPADGDCSQENISRTRRLCATALRTWRAAGNRKRAVWFRFHISHVGYPFSRGQMDGSFNRHAAWMKRYYEKHPDLMG